VPCTSYLVEIILYMIYSAETLLAVSVEVHSGANIRTLSLSSGYIKEKVLHKLRGF
jgi:hypothetical protein